VTAPGNGERTGHASDIIRTPAPQVGQRTVGVT
jgi:hypothetical protein